MTARRRPAVSLVELIVALVILGLIAALAIPQFGRAAQRDTDVQLRQSLAALRTAIELYYQDHRAYPAQCGDGIAPDGTPAAFLAQLTRPTDATGVTADQPDERFCFGPYLRTGLPTNPFGGVDDGPLVYVLRGSEMPCVRPEAGAAAWIYNCDSGYIVANTPGVDHLGVAYERY